MNFSIPRLLATFGLLSARLDAAQRVRGCAARSAARGLQVGLARHAAHWVGPAQLAGAGRRQCGARVAATGKGRQC